MLPFLQTSGRALPNVIEHQLYVAFCTRYIVVRRPDTPGKEAVSFDDGISSKGKPLDNIKWRYLKLLFNIRIKVINTGAFCSFWLT